MMWPLAVMALGVWAASSAHAQSIPQYVKGPMSGFAEDCKQQKQAFDAKNFVSSVDLDGDGKPDFILDIARGCAANKLLYCADDGCLIDVFISSTELNEAGHHAHSFRVGKRGDKPALILKMSGQVCGAVGKTCEKTLFWDGQGLSLQ